MEKLNGLVICAAEARQNGHFLSSNSYARAAMGIANKHKQMSISGKLIVLIRKNHEDLKRW